MNTSMTSSNRNCGFNIFFILYFGNLSYNKQNVKCKHYSHNDSYLVLKTNVLHLVLWKGMVKSWKEKLYRTRRWRPSSEI